MKKLVCIMMTLVVLLAGISIPNELVGASNISIALSSSAVSIGDSVNATITIPENITGPIHVSFSNEILEVVGTTGKQVKPNGGSINISMGAFGLEGTNRITITFKAKTSGTANVSVSHGELYDDNTYEPVTLGTASVSIAVANQASASQGGGTSQDSQKSGDNSLSSLKLSAGSLSPSFKPNTTKYTASVNYNVKQVVVSARTSNSKAVIESVTGNGTVNLEVGQNTIEIIVRAENGVKAKYTIVVTRKTESESEPQESESEDIVVNEMLQWNGEQLKPTKEIPKESIPADFETTSVVVNGQQMPGLSFGKGELKVVYLNNSNEAGSLYVYDEEQQTIYPFIKIEAEKSYVMVLLPNEQKNPAPEGFESCTFSIEGKGLVTAYQLKDEGTTEQEGTEAVEDSTSAWNIFGAETFYAAEPKVSEFYLIYCMNDAGEKGWYMYDSVEETFQRYLVLAPSVQADAEVDLESENASLKKELNAAKTTQYIIIGVAAVVVILLIGAIVIIVIKNRSKDDFFDEYDDEDDYDDYYRAEEHVQADDQEEEKEEVAVVDVDLIAETVGKKVEAVDDGDLEFIDFD